MNKSIMKTRSELQRITYKINQLKTKYTSENYVQFDVSPVASLSKQAPHHHQSHSHHNNYMHMQTNQDQHRVTKDDRDKPITKFLGENLKNRRDKGLNEHSGDVLRENTSQPQMITVEAQSQSGHKSNKKKQTGGKNDHFTPDHNMDKKIMGVRKSVPVTVLELDTLTQNNNASDPNSNVNHGQFVSKKDLKNLKNQLCAYLDKSIGIKIKQMHQNHQNQVCERLEQYVNEQIKTQLQNVDIQSDDREIIQNTQSRVTKLEEQLTSCLSSIEQIYTQLQQFAQSKNDISEEQVTQTVKMDPDFLEKYQNNMLANLNKLNKQLEQKLQNKIESINSEMIEKIQDYKSSQIELSNQLKNMQIEHNKLNQLRVQDKKQNLEWMNSQIESIIQSTMTQHNQYIAQQIQNIIKSMEPIEQIIRQQQEFSEMFAEINAKIDNIKADSASHSQKTQDKKELKQLDDRLCEISRNLGQLKAKNNEIIQQQFLIKQNIQQQKSFNAEQFAELSNKYKNQLEIFKKQITLYQSLVNQNKSQLSTQINALKNQINCLEAKITSKSKGIECSESTSGTINAGEVDQKLNQFENDINETLKLLYEDIQNRVNEMMIKGTGMPTGIENQIHSIQQRLFQLIQNNNHQGRQQFQSFQKQNQSEAVRELREQLSNTIGSQIDRLSQIVERTVEEIQIKMEKLDNNFNYVYEKMSAIEYDNAMFKDQISHLQQKKDGERRNSFDNVVSSENSDNNKLLDILGNFSNPNFSRGSLQFLTDS